MNNDFELTTEAVAAFFDMEGRYRPSDKQLAGVIEGTTNRTVNAPDGAHACVSDLSLRPNL